MLELLNKDLLFLILHNLKDIKDFINISEVSKKLNYIYKLYYPKIKMLKQEYIFYKKYFYKINYCGDCLYFNPYIQFKCFPDIKIIKKIHTLILENKNIKYLSNLSNFSDLLYLFLQNNKIKKIDTLYLPKLQKICLEYNKLKNIPSFTNMNNLLDIKLNNNKISKLPEIISLPYLSYLNLSNNLITEIPNIKGLPNLKYLNLSNNRIKKIYNLEHINNLYYLNLENNLLENIPDFKHLSKLKKLNLSKNNLTKFPILANLKKLKKLFIDYSLYIGKIENIIYI